MKSVDVTARAEGTRKRGRGVEPGSFLDLMIGSRHQGSGEGFTDMEATSQAFTFLLAGYGSPHLNVVLGINSGLLLLFDQNPS